MVEWRRFRSILGVSPNLEPSSKDSQSNKNNNEDSNFSKVSPYYTVDQEKSARISHKGEEEELNKLSSPSNFHYDNIDDNDEYQANLMPPTASSSSSSTNSLPNHRNVSNSKKKSIKLFVAHIPESLNRNGLRNIFEECVNEIQDIRIIKSKKDPNDGDFGFVWVSSTRDAICAIRHLDGKTIGDKRLLVKVDNNSNENSFSPESHLNNKYNHKTNSNGDDSIKNDTNLLSNDLKNMHQNQVNQFFEVFEPKNSCQDSVNVKSLNYGNKSKQQTNDFTSEHCNNFSCKKSPKIICKICKKTKYCSQNCQVEDWDNHHKLCVTNLLSNAGIKGIDDIFNDQRFPTRKALQISDVNSYHKIQSYRLEVANFIITYKTDTEIWIIFEDDSHLFVEIDNKIRDYIASQDSLTKPDKLRPGDIILAPFEDSYHRALVLNNISESHVKIFYFDFGNISSIASSRLFFMPHQIAEFSPMIFTFSNDLFMRFCYKFTPKNLQSTFVINKAVLFGNTIMNAEEINELPV